MVRIDDSGDVVKCWLSPDELERLERVAGDEWTWEREVAMQLMGRCSLRADEVDYPGPADLRWSDDGDYWLFEVRGKNTKGGDPKVRDAWMPDDVQNDVHKFARERGIADGDPGCRRRRRRSAGGSRTQPSASRMPAGATGGRTCRVMTSGGRG